MAATKKAGKDPASKITALCEALDGVIGGALDNDIDLNFKEPGHQKLQDKINQLIAACRIKNQESDDYHAATMGLALGISECFAVLAAAQDGDLSVRVSDEVASSSDELMANLAAAINTTIGELQKTVAGQEEQITERTEELHNASMEVALGLSDCFRALSEVRTGDLSARVEEMTLGSSDELLSKFGHDLNLTLDDFQETVERQRIAIQTLSTPILQIWEDVLALPVIGVVDSQRAAELMETLLAAIVEEQAKYVILDITGVDVIDTRTADHFLKLISSAQLLGTQCVVTGIQPAVAQTLVELRVDLSSITTMRNLQEGLRECLRRKEGRKAGAGKVSLKSGPTV